MYVSIGVRSFTGTMLQGIFFTQTFYVNTVLLLLLLKIFTVSQASTETTPKNLMDNGGPGMAEVLADLD